MITLEEARKLVEQEAIWRSVGPYRSALVLPFESRTVQQILWPHLGPLPTDSDGLFQAWHRYPWQQEMAVELLARQVVRLCEQSDGLRTVEV